MLKVILTIDAEVSSQLPGGLGDLAANIDRDVYGRTNQGEFGLTYQLKLLHEHGLKAVFFVESLFTEVAGPDPVGQIVESIRKWGQDVQLHLHAEWLAHAKSKRLPQPRGRSLNSFSQDEQEALIGVGLENLARCGAENVQAFRAGNFGANAATLAALQSVGLSFDSSYNHCVLGRDCDLNISPPPMRPTEIDSILEFPVSVFRDGPNHWRPAQLCACSFREMKAVLLRAWESQWPCVVLVWHTFELIHRDKTRAAVASPDWIVIRRFHRLLEFLSSNKNKFATVCFTEAAADLGGVAPLPAIRTGLHETSWRMVEQAVRRFH